MAFGDLLTQGAVPAHWLVLCFVSIATSSAFYTWVWYRPNDFKAVIAPADPCSVMAKMAHTLKVIQFFSIYKCTNLSPELLAGVPAWQWATLLALGAFGQHLNMRVYQLLGQDGVYYGSRFGKDIPWATGWPYNTLRDPQYLGSLLSLAAMAPLVPAEILTWWACNYFYLIALESKVPSTTPPPPAVLSKRGAKKRA